MENILNRFSQLLSYPGENYFQEIESFSNDLEEGDVKNEIDQFKSRSAELEIDTLREMYTRTFDLKSLTCLDVGYVLFGEDYKRGAFLVQLKSIMAKYGIECGSELPDNLPNFLKLLNEMETSEERTELIEKICLPALLKINQDFERSKDNKNVFHLPIKGLIANLEKKFKANEIVLQGAPVC